MSFSTKSIKNRVSNSFISKLLLKSFREPTFPERHRPDNHYTFGKELILLTMPNIAPVLLQFGLERFSYYLEEKKQQQKIATHKNPNSEEKYKTLVLRVREQDILEYAEEEPEKIGEEITECHHCDHCDDDTVEELEQQTNEKDSE